MKHMHTPSHTFMAVRFDTTGNVERNAFEVVKKLSIVVTPETHHKSIGEQESTESGAVRHAETVYSWPEIPCER